MNLLGLLRRSRCLRYFAACKRKAPSTVVPLSPLWWRKFVVNPMHAVGLPLHLDARQSCILYQQVLTCLRCCWQVLLYTCIPARTPCSPPPPFPEGRCGAANFCPTVWQDISASKKLFRVYGGNFRAFPVRKSSITSGWFDIESSVSIGRRFFFDASLSSHNMSTNTAVCSRQRPSSRGNSDVHTSMQQARVAHRNTKR